MSNSRLIEIVSAAGEGFAFGPAGVEGPGQLLKQPSAEAWSAWLQQNFARKFAEQARHWEQIVATVAPSHRAQAPQTTFRHVAKLIDQQTLQARRLPVPAAAVTAAPAGAPATAMRTLESGSSKVAADSSRGTPASKGAAVDDVGQDTASLQLKGDPVAPVSGEEILTLDDFTVAAPMPLRWQRWYRSRQSDQDLGLGAGWFAECLRRIWQDDDATWVLDREARPVRLPRLERGEIAWQAVGGQRLERRRDDRMVLTERDGRVWIFAPDTQGNWRPVSVQNSLGHQWLLHYDAGHRLSRLELTPARSLTFAYGKGTHLREISLVSGDHREVLASYGYSELPDSGTGRDPDLVSATTATGTERYRYRSNLLIGRQLPSGYQFSFEWDGAGPGARCIRTRGEDGSYDFSFDYLPDKFLTRVTDAFGAVQVFHYDNQGRITARQDPDGGVHQWQYNARGQLTGYCLPDGRTTTYGFDLHGRPVLDRFPDGREHHRQFNALGFCVGETLPDGRTIKRRFDALGRLLAEQRADGSNWTYHYDTRGWLSEACSDTGEVHRTGFSRAGELCAAEDRGNLNRYAFDEQGRVKGHLAQDLVTGYDYHAGQISAVHQYPEQAPQQRQSRFYRYDEAGRLNEFTSATGAVHGYEYAGLARPVRYQRPDGKSVFYRYDKAERLIDVIRPDGAQWKLSYNSKGQVSACQAPDGRHIEFRYDAAGEIIHREQAGDWVQHLKRDAGGRVLQQNSQGRDRAPVSRQFQYDKFGRRTSATCADRRLSWRYDAPGQVSEHQQDQHLIRYEYGPGQRLELIRLPDGNEVRYHYDRLGRWDHLEINGQAQLHRQFDDQGRETLREAGANRQTQVWDRHNRLVNRRWQGQEACIRRYSWDAESRLEQYEDTREGKRQYQRDSQGQLIAENDQTFAYDDGGNRATRSDQIQQDRLLQSGQTKRRYDALGAETEVRGPKTQRRRFDAEGQLIEVTGDGLHVQYGYDALGRRAWRKSVEGTVTYFWHNDVLLGEQRDGNWQWYIRDPQSDAPLLTLIEGEAHFAELDWRGAPVRLWDPNGELSWEGHADGWGSCHSQGKIRQSLRLPGQFADELTGLHFNRFRDYDPQAGRYLTPDPLGIKGGLNSYRYTPNPVDYIDPLGLNACSGMVPGPEDAEAGDMAPVMEDAPEFQNIELAGAAAALARAPAPTLPPTSPGVTRVAVGTAANDAVYASQRSWLARALPVASTAATFIGGMLYSPELGGGLEQITGPDGTVYSKHGDERIWNASGTDGANWQTVSPQEDMEYRAWLANGGNGSFEDWLFEGRSRELVAGVGGDKESIPKNKPVNPLDDPKVAKQIQEDPLAVYGYAPKPGKGLDKFDIDFTDPDQVASARAKRIDYLDDLERKKSALASEVADLKREGVSIEDIARGKVEKRNQDRIKSYLESGNLEGLKAMQERNLIEYGRKEGPTADQLFEMKGSWDNVIFGSVKSSRAMDLLLGLN